TFMLRPRFSVVASAWRTTGRFALLRRALRLFRVKAAFLAATDAAVRPQALEDHFSGGCRGRFVLAAGYAELVRVAQQVWNFSELLVALISCSDVGNLQFAARLKPLNHR